MSKVIPIIRVGNENRPATEADIKDIADKFDEIYESKEPRVVVTHHAIDVVYVSINEDDNLKVVASNSINSSE